MSGAEGPATASSAHVLLADDDSDLADRLAAHLRAFGFAVTTSGDGTDAVHRVKAEAFDAFVIDMMLPGVSGFQVVRTVRALHGPDVPVVMISEFTAVEHRDYAFLIGVDRFLGKPPDPDDLVVVLQTLLVNAP